jgi:hypothetical protein
MQQRRAAGPDDDRGHHHHHCHHHHHHRRRRRRRLRASPFVLCCALVSERKRAPSWRHRNTAPLGSASVSKVFVLANERTGGEQQFISGPFGRPHRARPPRERFTRMPSGFVRPTCSSARADVATARCAARGRPSSRKSKNKHNNNNNSQCIEPMKPNQFSLFARGRRLIRAGGSRGPCGRASRLIGPQKSPRRAPRGAPERPALCERTRRGDDLIDCSAGPFDRN